jgi:hypothetical protein
MEDQVRRSIMIALIALLALALAAPAVLATGNGGAPGDGTQHYDPDFLAQYPGHCDFRMQIDLTGKSKLITLPDGGVVFSAISASPDLYATITNLDNGKHATFNVTGAVITKKPDSQNNVETVLTGNNLALDPVAGTVITSGRYTFVFDASGNVVQPLQGQGQLTDVCKVLS